MGGRGQPLAAPLSPLGPIRPITSPVVLITLPALRIYPVTPGTHPVSEKHHPIYHSLCIDHFETHRHVRDHIRAPNYLWYIKTHKLIIPIVIEH